MEPMPGQSEFHGLDRRVVFFGQRRAGKTWASEMYRMWWESRSSAEQDRWRAYGIKPMKGKIWDTTVWDDGLEDGYWIATRGSGDRNAVLYKNADEVTSGTLRVRVRWGSWEGDCEAVDGVLRL